MEPLARACISNSTSRPTRPASTALSEDSEPRELTVDEAVELAMLLQRQAQLAAAGQLYARVLDVVPDHVEPSPRTARRSSCVPSTSTPTTISGSCSMRCTARSKRPRGSAG